MEECKKIWKALLTEIANNVSTVAFEMWFERLEPLTISYNKLVVVAPLNNNKSVIVNEFHSIIDTAIARLNTYVNGLIVITPEEKHLYTNTEPAETNDGSKPLTLFNENFTFDNFVVGPSNQVAYAAAKSVAEDPGNQFNPLFIYGGVGLGKTHIVHAIGNFVQKKNAKSRILYVTTEQFVNDFIDSIRNSKDNEQNRQFREKYRNVDILILDDIQFIAGKTTTQEALFHTFNDLYQSKKQIVLTSDRHPKELTFLEERLQSRFQCGLTCDITQPDIETRIAILQKKAFAKKFNVSQSVIYFIADKIDSNIRELEGALSKVIFYCSLVGKEANNIDVVKEALKDDIDVSKHILSIDSIVEVTCAYYNIPKADVIGKKKLKQIVTARQVAIYLINDLLGVPLATIGNYFGGRDHATIIYARDKISKLEKTDPMLATQIKDIRNIIQKK